MTHLHLFKARALIRAIYITKAQRVPPFPFSVMGAAATCQLPYKLMTSQASLLLMLTCTPTCATTSLLF